MFPDFFLIQLQFLNAFAIGAGLNEFKLFIYYKIFVTEILKKIEDIKANYKDKEKLKTRKLYTNS